MSGRPKAIQEDSNPKTEKVKCDVILSNIRLKEKENHLTLTLLCLLPL